MSQRRRHKKSEPTKIEWLKHRTGYPTPDEREQIIRLRRELSVEFIMATITQDKSRDKKMQALIDKYGEDEVERARQNFSQTMQPFSFIADDAKSYRDYRQRYARFGEGLKFYTTEEMDELHKRYFKSINETDDLHEPTKLDRLLLFGWRDWEDITPPAIPVRPDDFIAPQPASYPAPINELLEWGDDLYKSHDFAGAADFQNWKKFTPALTRMALDKGLLNGWPAENSSWAPWHAIHALGALQAWESAPALADLADLENDWLSDHLPHIWVDMGIEVEPSLWMILENPSASKKQRGLAAQSLQMLSEESEAIEGKVIKGFQKLIGNTKAYDPTVNAYIIHFLNQMGAAEDIWKTIELAFMEERVDLGIITPEDLEFDD